MSKLVQTIVIVAAGMAALAYAGPTLVALTRALVPLVLVAGVVVAALWLVRYFTQP
jgi:uncharacterized protein (DUF697 family)